MTVHMRHVFILNTLVLLYCSSSLASVKISPCARWNTTGITVAGTGEQGNDTAQLGFPKGIFIDKQTKTLYVADSANRRIQVFSLNRSSPMGNTVAFDVEIPVKIYVDDDNDGSVIYMALRLGDRVEKWIRGASRGIQVGEECRACSGVWVDKEKNVYMSETFRDRVVKWSPQTNITTVVAGQTDDRGSTDTQLDSPDGIYVDQTSGSIYVSDVLNNRVQRWEKNAQKGFTMAGSSIGNGGTDGASLLQPGGIWVDEETNILYVADTYNHRIQRWSLGASKGNTIAGGSGQGNARDQFYYPSDLAFDNEGNLYVCDSWNHRVQFFELIDNRPCPPTSTASFIMYRSTMMTTFLSFLIWIIAKAF